MRTGANSLFPFLRPRKGDVAGLALGRRPGW